MRIKVDIPYINDQAKGVINYDNKKYYVSDVLKGEEVIIETFKNDCKLCEIKKESSNRVKPKCSVYNLCGGCQIMHMDYNEQLRFKKNNVIKYFKDNNLNVKVNDCIGMDNPYNYRNKSFESYGISKSGNIISGIYEEYSHKIVSNDECLLESIDASNIFKNIKTLMKKHKIMPYDEVKKTGIIKHVMIKTSLKNKEVMVVFVTNSELFHGSKDFIKDLVKECNITTVIQNINPRNTSIVLGEKEKVLYGKGYITDTLMNVNFKISSKSFYQINPIQTEKLYQKAIKMADLSKNDVVLDAYCGIGSISLSLAKDVKKVIGVEIVKEAIIDAKANAKFNNINNAIYILDDASKFMINNKEKFDCVFIDPPRKGCDERFIQSLAFMAPKKIIYISCDPKTQARDLKLLLSLKDYEIKECQPVDMFPHTLHVETISVLTKKMA